MTRYCRRASLAILAGIGLFLALPALARRGALPGADGPTFAYGADPAQMVMLLAAPGPGPHPAVFFVHGGGWVQGNPRGGRALAPALNAAGYTVISIGYRLVPQTDLAGATADAAQAIAYTVRNAQRFGIDANRFALAGHSSGATLVALLATDPRYLRQAGIDPARVAAILLLDGVYDIAANVTNFPSEQRMDVFGQNPAVWRQFSPNAYIPAMANHPRFCFAHEDRNPRFVEQAGIFLRTLRANRQTVDDLLVPGVSHGDMLWQASNPSYPIASFATRCLSAALPERG